MSAIKRGRFFTSPTAHGEKGGREMGRGGQGEVGDRTGMEKAEQGSGRGWGDGEQRGGVG